MGPQRIPSINSPWFLKSPNLHIGPSHGSLIINEQAIKRLPIQQLAKCEGDNQLQVASKNNRHCNWLAINDCELIKIAAISTVRVKIKTKAIERGGNRGKAGESGVEKQRANG